MWWLTCNDNTCTSGRCTSFKYSWWWALAPETCRVTAEIKPAVLHQVGVSFDCKNDFQCRTRVRKFRCTQMVGAILDFTPCNLLNVRKGKYTTKVKHKKKSSLEQKTAANTSELFYVNFSLFWIDLWLITLQTSDCVEFNCILPRFINIYEH